MQLLFPGIQFPSGICRGEKKLADNKKITGQIYIRSFLLS